MSTSYENAGRTNQKQRTREALVSAARQLVADGLVPTIEQAAEQAHISRTTAYRYFPSQALLLAAAHPEISITTVLGQDAPENLEDRVDLVVAYVTNMVRDTEPQQRTMLRLSLDPDRKGSDDLVLRQGRVIRWLEDGLAPLVDEIGRNAVHRVAVSIRCTIGIESFVWLTDVARLQPEEAIAIMRWNAKSLVQAALGGSLPPIDNAPPTDTPVQ